MTNKEKFTKIIMHGASDNNMRPTSYTETVNIVNPYNLNSEAQTNLYNTEALDYYRERASDRKQAYLDNISQQYKQMLLAQNRDVTFFYNDTIDQNKIMNTPYNIVNQIPPIDFSDVTTGMDKCRLFCKNGTCMEGGYTGVASCIPKPDKPFDWGTLYKNPEFTYGLQVPYYNKNNQTF